MAQLMICSSCKKHYDSVHNEKPKSYFKTCNDCRHIRKQRACRKTQQPSQSIQNNEDNRSTKSSAQQT